MANSMLEKLRGRLRRNNQNLMNLSISIKIVIYYLLLLITSLAISSLIFQNIFSKIITDKISDHSFKILHSVSSIFNSAVNIGSEYSKIIISNEDVRNMLKEDFNESRVIEAEFTNIKNRKLKDLTDNANKTLSRLLGGVEFISSVYIFGASEAKAYAYKDIARTLDDEKMKNSSWYKEVKNKKGGYIIKLNAGDAFKDTYKVTGKEANTISVIREINDLDTQKTIGTIVVNISESMISRMLTQMNNTHDSEIYILDENDKVVVNIGKQYDFYISDYAFQNMTKDQSWTVWKNNNTEHLASYLKMPETGWKIISILPIRQLSEENSIFALVTIAMILINGILLFVGSIFISRFVTIPIKKLILAMKDMETGKFKKIETKYKNDEIGLLFDGYNAMVVEIQNLISRIVEEQKIKRKAELDVLQAQIKPHFLYNTFDSISSLALAGKNTDVYNMMKALGTYYRISLSKGREVITIGEEIDIVINYLKIQKYRYEDLFSVQYDIEEETKCYQILKLVLQPFVENALYHGIKPTGVTGIIKINVKKGADAILLQVTDNGVGINGQELEILKKYPIDIKNTSFGIWGTIERLKIFYGTEDVVNIKSQKGGGTTVTIKIPLLNNEKVLL